MNLFATTNPKVRALGKMLIIGIVAGILSAFVKSGLEGILPPRLPGAVPPPIEFLKLFGITTEGMTYTWLNQTINYGGNGVHILFSVVFATIYCVVAEILPNIKLLKGFVYGYAVALGSHYVIFPLIGIHDPFSIEGFISELIGTGLWMWTIEAFRSYLRRGWTGYVSAEEQQATLTK